MTLQFGTAWGLDSGSDGLNWRLRGACADPQWDPNLWTSTRAEDRGQAVWLCRRECDVRARCFAWAKDNPRVARGGVYGGYWWTSRLESRPAHPVNVTERRPLAVPALDSGEPAFSRTPATDAERIAWAWAAGVPLETIADRLGCSRQAVADRIGELAKADRPRPPCGTIGGFKAHRRRGEQTCTACRAANAEGKRARAAA